MVNFGQIEKKDVKIPFDKDDIEGYIVTGVAGYDKEDKLTYGRGEIRETDGVRVASFNLSNIRGELRLSIGNCIADRMNDAVSVAEATIADLKLGYNR